MADTKRRRRVPIRYVVLGVIAALVMGSERWDGPFTFEALQRAGASATGAASAEPAPGSPIPMQDREVGEVHLTFDDGPHPKWTGEILDVLAKHDAVATFFPIGSQVALGEAQLSRAVAGGHRVGNHTWNHDTLVGVDQERFDDVVGRAATAIRESTGVSPTCLRPPGGQIDTSTRALARADGLSVEMWTIDPQDWREPGADAIVDEVVGRATAGAVVLLHDGGGDRSQTVRALDQLLEQLGSAGFRFTALPDC